MSGTNGIVSKVQSVNPAHLTPQTEEIEKMKVFERKWILIEPRSGVERCSYCKTWMYCAVFRPVVPLMAFKMCRDLLHPGGRRTDGSKHSVRFEEQCFGNFPSLKSLSLFHSPSLPLLSLLPQFVPLIVERCCKLVENMGMEYTSVYRVLSNNTIISIRPRGNSL